MIPSQNIVAWSRVVPWTDSRQVEQDLMISRALVAIFADSELRFRVDTALNKLHFDPPVEMPFTVKNPWFTASAHIVTYSTEELLATKLRALLQRNKGRDLFDLSYALNIFKQLDVDRLITLFGKYLALSEQTISQAKAQERMFAKLANPNFLADIRPLLSAEQAALLTERSIKEAFENVFSRLICRIPGDPWLRCDEMKQRFGIL